MKMIGHVMFAAILLNCMLIQVNGKNEWCSPVRGTSFKPELEDASSPQEDFFVNEMLDLYCCFQSKEKVHVVWLKDNQTITSKARYKFSENNQVLTIPKASMSDGGKYRCQGSNKYGKESWNIHVIIHRPVCKRTPEIRARRSIVTARKGSRANLSCIVTVDASCNAAFPSYTWKDKLGKLEPRAHSKNFKAKVSAKGDKIRMKLRIRSVKRRHAGYHTCIVTDLYGKRESNVRLIVL